MQNSFFLINVALMLYLLHLSSTSNSRITDHIRLTRLTKKKTITPVKIIVTYIKMHRRLTERKESGACPMTDERFMSGCNLKG